MKRISVYGLLIAAGTKAPVRLVDGRYVSAGPLISEANVGTSNRKYHKRKLCAGQMAWHPNRSSGDYLTGYCHFVMDCNSIAYSSGLDCCNGAYSKQSSNYCLSRLALPVASNQILEFSNASGEPKDKEAFCDGIQDELNNSLAQDGYYVRDVECNNFEFVPGWIQHLMQRRYLQSQRGTLSVETSINADYRPAHGQDERQEIFGLVLEDSINRDGKRIVKTLEERGIQAVAGATLESYEQEQEQVNDSHIRIDPIPGDSPISTNHEDEQGVATKVPDNSPSLTVEKNSLPSSKPNANGKSKNATLAIAMSLTVVFFCCAGFLVGALLKRNNEHDHLKIHEDDGKTNESKQARRSGNDDLEEASREDLSTHLTGSERNILGRASGSQNVAPMAIVAPDNGPIQLSSENDRGWSSSFEEKLRAKFGSSMDDVPNDDQRNQRSSIDQRNQRSSIDTKTKKKRTQLAHSTADDAGIDFERRLARKAAVGKRGHTIDTSTDTKTKTKCTQFVQSITDDEGNDFERRLMRKAAVGKKGNTIDTSINTKTKCTQLVQSTTDDEGSDFKRRLARKAAEGKKRCTSDTKRKEKCAQSINATERRSIKNIQEPTAQLSNFESRLQRKIDRPRTKENNAPIIIEDKSRSNKKMQGSRVVVA